MVQIDIISSGVYMGGHAPPPFALTNIRLPPQFGKNYEKYMDFYFKVGQIRGETCFLKGGGLWEMSGKNT